MEAKDLKSGMNIVFMHRQADGNLGMNTGRVIKTIEDKYVKIRSLKDYVSDPTFVLMFHMDSMCDICCFTPETPRDFGYTKLKKGIWDKEKSFWQNIKEIVWK